MAADTEQAPNAAQKARIFISYSRKDLAFADRLEAMLKARGFEALIDRTEIYAFEDWWKRIESLIVKADTIIFVLSPDAVASEICAKEVAFAASLNKRFAPLVCRRVEDSAVPEELRRLHFIFFDDPARFDTSADDLTEALRTDIDWIRQHTEFGEQARRWAVAGRPGPRGLLLRSPVLEAAERWIASRPHDAPAPTEETQAFVAESRRGASRRRNIVTGSLAAGLLVALVLAGIAYWQRGLAVAAERAAQAQRKLADEQRDLAERRRVAALAQLASSEQLRGNEDTAIRLAVHATRLDMRLDPQHGATSLGRTALAVALWQSNAELTLSEGRVGGDSWASFSPDGRQIVTASDNNVALIWDSATGKELRSLRGHEQSIYRALFSPDGKRIITASFDATVRIWNATTGELITILKGHDDAVLSASFSPDGKRVVTSSMDRTIRLWESESGKLIATLPKQANGVSCAVFSPDGKRFVTTTSDENGLDVVQIWDIASLKLILTIHTYKGSVHSVAFSNDGLRIITADGFDNGAEIYDVRTGRRINVIDDSKNTGRLNSVEFSRDDRYVVTASADGSARVWELASGKQTFSVQGNEPLTSAAFSPDSMHILTTSSHAVARIWRLPTGHQLTSLSGNRSATFTSAKFSFDGTKIVASSVDDHAYVWDAVTSKQLFVLNGHYSPVTCAAFSPDGRRIATASGEYHSASGWSLSNPTGAQIDDTGRIWDATTGKELLILKGLGDIVSWISFSPDASRVATASWDGTVRIWDATTGKQLLMTTDKYYLFSVGFNSDGSRLVAAGVSNTKIWDATSGESIEVLPSGATKFATFDPTHPRVVVVSDMTATVWDTGLKQEMVTLRGHTGQVNYAQFSLDGSRIVTASDDATARIWDATSGAEIAVLAGHDKSVKTAEFSPDASRMVTASEDGTVRVWDVRLATESAAALIAGVCLQRMRGLTILNRDEMRMAGYTDDTAEIDVCQGVE